MICPKCKKEIHSFHRYFVFDKDTDKVIEVCEKCYKKRQVRAVFSRVVRGTKVVG